MKTSFSSSDRVFRCPFNVKEPIPFYDAQEKAELRLNFSGSADVKYVGEEPKKAALQRLISDAAAPVLTEALSAGTETYRDLYQKKTALEDKVEQALAAQGVTANVSLIRFAPAPGAYPHSQKKAEPVKKERVCAYCGRKTEPGVKICPFCGAPVTE